MTAREFWKFKTMSSDGMTLDTLCAFAEAYAAHVSPEAAEPVAGETNQEVDLKAEFEQVYGPISVSTAVLYEAFRKLKALLRERAKKYGCTTLDCSWHEPAPVVAAPAEGKEVNLTAKKFAELEGWKFGKANQATAFKFAESYADRCLEIVVAASTPPPADPMTAKDFHHNHCGIAIPLYAILDKESGLCRQPTTKEIMARMYEFAEAYARYINGRS